MLDFCSSIVFSSSLLTKVSPTSISNQLTSKLCRISQRIEGEGGSSDFLAQRGASGLDMAKGKPQLQEKREKEDLRTFLHREGPRAWTGLREDLNYKNRGRRMIFRLSCTKRGINYKNRARRRISKISCTERDLGPEQGQGKASIVRIEGEE
ncbi:hypothetical protein KFK09_006632 [Dendrobium nobile]|uniref:Uncharacterized protein n=1 Tax=Dendrobium nobile TaxID=94219 RepID=A0A8T3BRW3_DENNO|nr:hypothetical protein KFK09_006632 [Dendrobium nobile]